MRDNNNEAIKFSITTNCIGSIDHRLFGQFLEKASFGEPGPEAAVDIKTGKLRSEVEEFIDDMQIPVIRFPGGTDIDSSDWRDMVDNVPGRGGKRPEKSITERGSITNLYSYDEFLQFAERINTEAILVVNLQDALSRKMPLKEATLIAAGQVAYCNAPVGTSLPDGMPDWPAVRAKNGRVSPYKVRYFQIGNETWGFLKSAFEAVGLTDVIEQSQWYIDCVISYIDAMKQIDPSIEIIMDGFTDELSMRGFPHSFNKHIIADKELSEKVDYTTFHIYYPGGVRKILKNDVEVPTDSLTDEELWYAWAATPSFSSEGKAVLPDEIISAIQEYNVTRPGREYSMTEWNWNGFLTVGGKYFDDGDLFVRGIGAAGFLHALMRSGSYIKIANQSNLIGSTWNIGAVRVDKEGTFPPYIHPTGLITTFYGKNHGSKMLELLEENVPVYSQPFNMNDPYPSTAFESVSMIDAIATEDDDVMYFHVINRNYSESYDVTLDFSKYKGLKGDITHHIFQCVSTNSGLDDGRHLSKLACIKDLELGQLKRNSLLVTLPEQSVSVIEIRGRFSNCENEIREPSPSCQNEIREPSPNFRVLMIGAHPDDCELCTGGIATKYRNLGHCVKFVSVTNGDTGHHILSGAELARVRANETAQACAISGIEVEVLDIHSNQLEADIKTREKIICLIREYKPDIIFTHRLCDYHPDHRRTSMLVQDSSYAVRVPNVCPSTPCLRYSPIIMYMNDSFQKPVEFQADVVVDIDDVVDTKIKMMDCHKSQIFEWLPWIDNDPEIIPADETGRRNWIMQRYIVRDVNAANKYRQKLEEVYGYNRGNKVYCAEAFEISEYGKQPTDEEIKCYFPF